MIVATSLWNKFAGPELEASKATTASLFSSDYINVAVVSAPSFYAPLRMVNPASAADLTVHWL